MPSEPIVLDKKILYKNPKNFSQTEKTVITATVLKNPFKISCSNQNSYKVFYSTENVNIIFS